MIRLRDLTLLRGGRVLLEHAELTLNPGEHVGLVGVNGSGKSSLFALLRGEFGPDGGSADWPPTWRLAHVAQETPALALPALEFVLDGDTRLRALEQQLRQAEDAGDGTRMAELHGALADADAYTAPARAEQLLAGLGFATEAMRQPVASFSGGWRMRLNLAQALMCPSDLLLLDEPTNHLDLDAILWLEDWLRSYAGTLIVISHDRDFLDGVVSVVVHIDQQRLTRYAGGYSDFEAQRAVRLEQAQVQRERQVRERAHLQSFIDRFKAKASKARQAQSRMKMLARMQELAPIHAAASLQFEFFDPARTPDPALVLEGIEAGYDPAAPVLRGVNLALRAGARIGLLGANGAGKSTLIKTLVGELPPLAGRRLAGTGLEVGYFAQHQLERLDPGRSAFAHLREVAEAQAAAGGGRERPREQVLRDYLGRFLFAGERAEQPIAPFSGGEKARLALALIVWQRPNLLMLDEPTNHLDLDAREALTVALAQFEGTLVLVSHDRHLLRACTDEFLIVADGRVQPFDGDLDDYRQWLAERQRARASPASAAKPGGDDVSRRDEARLRQPGRLKPVQRRLQTVEAELEVAQGRLRAVETRLADPVLYASAGGELPALVRERTEAVERIEALEGPERPLNPSRAPGLPVG